MKFPSFHATYLRKQGRGFLGFDAFSNNAEVELVSQRLVTISARQRCWMTCQKHDRCSMTAAMLPAASETPCRLTVSSSVSRLKNFATSHLDTASAATDAAAAL